MTTPILYTIASGKGGVGKTSFTVNLATQLDKLGHKVLVIDGDTGLANLDVQLNLQPQTDLSHVLAGTHGLADVITPTPQGFGLIAGRAGHAGLAGLPLPKLTQWLADVRTLATQQNYSHVLIDAAAGVAPQTLAMCAQANHTLLVTTPDPSSLTDAYALIKLLHLQQGVANCSLIVNQASVREAGFVHTKLTQAAQNFLKLPPLPFLASIPSDKNWSQAIRLHQLASTAFPSTASVEAIQSLAKSAFFTPPQSKAA